MKDRFCKSCSDRGRGGVEAVRDVAGTPMCDGCFSDDEEHVQQLPGTLDLVIETLRDEIHNLKKQLSRRVTREEVLNLIHGKRTQQTERVVEVGEIMKVASNFFGLKDLWSKKRSDEYVLARGVAYVVAREYGHTFASMDRVTCKGHGNAQHLASHVRCRIDPLAKATVDRFRKEVRRVAQTKRAA